MKVTVLGTDYNIEIRKFDDDPQFKARNICGYCDSQLKLIAVCDSATMEADVPKVPAVVEADNKETLRHEIIHAFLDESGLGASSLAYDGPWARNEEMVDWWAVQGPKVHVAWQEAGAI